MSDGPDFLPPILNLNGSWEDILNRLYSVFELDFKLNQTRHDGLRILYNKRILPDGQGKEEGFWHVISKKNPQLGGREIDYPRAKRLPWARPLMEAPPKPEFKVFDYMAGRRDKGVRRYIWLEKYDYVVILQRKKNIFYWVTAFYIDARGKRKDLKKRYEKRIQ